MAPTRDYNRKLLENGHGHDPQDQTYRDGSSPVPVPWHLMGDDDIILADPNAPSPHFYCCMKPEVAFCYPRLERTFPYKLACPQGSFSLSRHTGWHRFRYPMADSVKDNKMSVDPEVHRKSIPTALPYSAPISGTSALNDSYQSIPSSEIVRRDVRERIPGFPNQWHDQLMVALGELCKFSTWIKRAHVCISYHKLTSGEPGIHCYKELSFTEKQVYRMCHAYTKRFGPPWHWKWINRDYRGILVSGDFDWLNVKASADHSLNITSEADFHSLMPLEGGPLVTNYQKHHPHKIMNQNPEPTPRRTLKPTPKPTHKAMPSIVPDGDLEYYDDETNDFKNAADDETSTPESDDLDSDQLDKGKTKGDQEQEKQRQWAEFQKAYAEWNASNTIEDEDEAMWSEQPSNDKLSERSFLEPVSLEGIYHDPPSLEDISKPLFEGNTPTSSKDPKLVDFDEGVEHGHNASIQSNHTDDTTKRIEPRVHNQFFQDWRPYDRHGQPLLRTVDLASLESSWVEGPTPTLPPLRLKGFNHPPGWLCKGCGLNNNYPPWPSLEWTTVNPNPTQTTPPNPPYPLTKWETGFLNPSSLPTGFVSTAPYDHSRHHRHQGHDRRDHIDEAEMHSEIHSLVEEELWSSVYSRFKEARSSQNLEAARSRESAAINGRAVPTATPSDAHPITDEIWNTISKRMAVSTGTGISTGNVTGMATNTNTTMTQMPMQKHPRAFNATTLVKSFVTILALTTDSGITSNCDSSTAGVEQTIGSP